MRYLSGGTELDVAELARRLSRALDLPWERARGIVVEVIAALLIAQTGDPPAKDR